MAQMSQTAHADGDMLKVALTSLRIEIKNNQRLLERTAALVKIQEDQARVIETLVADMCQSSEVALSAFRDEPLYSAVLQVARRYCIATGKPVSRHDILYWLEVEGYTLNVTAPERFVSKNISMSKQFIAFEEGFWPSDIPAPDGLTPNRRTKVKTVLA